MNNPLAALGAQRKRTSETPPPRHELEPFIQFLSTSARPLYASLLLNDWILTIPVRIGLQDTKWQRNHSCYPFPQSPWNKLSGEVTS